MNLSSGLADYFPGDTASTTQLGLRPRADDFDVISLANDRHSTLVTANQGFIKKCKIGQEQDRECLYGLVLLPQGIEYQRRFFEDIQRRRRKLLHPEFETCATWADVRYENLLVEAHADGFPSVSDLCKCPSEA